MKINGKKVNWDEEYQRLAEKLDEEKRSSIGCLGSAFLLAVGCVIGIFWREVFRFLFG
jgi:hypothetical protein